MRIPACLLLALLIPSACAAPGRIERLEAENAELKAEVAKLRALLTDMVPDPAWIDELRIDDVPRITGLVSAVDPALNIVLLGVGRDDGVRAGFVFTIYRGNGYVAKVVIDKVEKDYCSGYSLKELEQTPIRQGDTATTRF